MSRAQTAYILKHMQDGLRISPMTAMKLFGCMRLGARIYDLRQMGHKIESQMVKAKNAMGVSTRYKEYWIDRSKRS